MPDISELKSWRRRASLTQAELSEKSGVSQSLIAKIESGKIVPSYDKAKRLFLALEEEGKKSELKAGEIMSKSPKFVNAGDNVKKAASIMEKNGFSQVPVRDKCKCLGVVTEQNVLKAISSGEKGLAGMKAGKVMGEPLPIVSESTSFPVLVGILRHEQAVLVSRKGKIAGIVTKSDLLKGSLGRRPGNG